MSKVLELLAHPIELKSAIVLTQLRKPLFPTAESSSTNPDLKRCYELLKLTSRSFAAVIMELNPELQTAVAIFYLVLRALDTIADDMTIEHDLKVDLLRNFDQKLELENWSFDGCAPTERDRVVLVDFPCIQREYSKLKPGYQKVIKEITNKMGNGMADYINDENFNLNGVQTVRDYDRYCYYVAGLVGDGLTQLFVLAGFASPSLLETVRAKGGSYADDADDKNALSSSKFSLYESMGLFLQKTNIIRDYAEDLSDGRSFWPKEIWSQYATNLTDFQKPEETTKGVYCVNHLVLNALEHVRDVLSYLASISEQSCFQFCAIPQVMAIATLALVFNNPQILHKNVKIRKGTTCYLILKSRTFRGCVEIFEYYLRDIRARLAVDDPNYLKINLQIAKIDQYIEEMYQSNLPPSVKPNLYPIYLKVQERSKYDKPVETIQEEENRQFNVYLTAVIALLLATSYLLL